MFSQQIIPNQYGNQTKKGDAYGQDTREAVQDIRKVSPG